MKNAKSLNQQIAELEKQKALRRWSSSRHFELKATKALRRYHRCKKRRRAEHHINQAEYFFFRASDICSK